MVGCLVTCMCMMVNLTLCPNLPNTTIFEEICLTIEIISRGARQAAADWKHFSFKKRLMSHVNDQTLKRERSLGDLFMLVPSLKYFLTKENAAS